MPKRIVLHPAAGLCERFAADELSKYLERMTGRALPVRVSASRREREIEIRVRRRAARRKLPLGETDDAFEINVRPERIVLSGTTGRAALYAAYAFLEELGCRWLAPAFDFYRTIGHELVPRLSEWPPRAGRRRFRPTFLYRRREIDEARSNTVANTIELIDWMAKNRLNALDLSTDYEGSGRFTWESVRHALLPEMAKRGILAVVGGHGYQNYMHPDEFFDEHPEWFGMIDGRRTRDPQCVFNTANRAAMRMFVSRVIAYLKAHPEIDILALWPPDRVAWSQDAESQAQGSPARRQAIVTTAVRNAIRREGLDVMLEVVSYASHADYPENYRYPSDVIVDLWPFYHEYREPIFDPSIHSAPRSLGPIQQWVERHPGILGAGGYYRKYKWLSKPVVFPGLMWAEMSYFRDRGIQGVCMQSEPGDWIAYEPQHYFYARLAYDTHQDVNLLVKEYCEGRFGAAADDMEQYVWTLAKATTRSIRLAAAEPTAHEVAQGRLWIDRCRSLLRRARRTLAKDAKACEMLRRLAVTLRHMEITFDLLDARHRGRPKQIAETVQRLLRLARRHASEGLFLDDGGHRFSETGLRRLYGLP